VTTTINDAPIPLYDAIARPKRKEFGKRDDPLEGHLTRPWVDYFNKLVQTVETSPSRISVVELTDQTTTIGATDMSGGGLSSGLYRVTWRARITQAASVSSSLTVTIDYVDDGLALSFSGAGITGNSITSWQSESKLLKIDHTTPVRYSTQYIYVGTAGKYELRVVLEEVKA
jgi:hypothetical protein